MSKKFKSQASSARAASTLTSGFGFGTSFQTSSSPLSYVTESPDLSQISEPNVVVAFKNLGKKDSTTKAKALEELQEFCGNHVEQGVLQAWAEIYPRTSIDNSRRVRQLAHAFQGNLTVSSGKRIAPFLPKVIGPWLAGTFDSDKSSSRSAQDALERSFTNPEKRKALWLVYKDALFSYIEDAIVMQTVATLSDERTTSSDDAQTKYARVVGTAMSLMTQLLRDGAQNDLVPTLLNGKTLWEFSYHDDPYLRRGACDLVNIACEKHSELLDWTAISTCFISKGLQTNQSGSSRQYTNALITLTRTRPQIWTTDYTAKASASKRFLRFLAKGSQNGTEDVWSNVANLVRLVPEQVRGSDGTVETATNIAEALRTGITQPAERVNAAAAWATYVQTCLWLAAKVHEGQADLLKQQLMPIIKQYVTKKDEPQWNLTTRALQICKGVLVGILKLGAISTFESTWVDLATATIDEMKLSQPETSKEFKNSQDAVIDQAKRLFSIKAEIMKTPEATPVVSIFDKTENEMLEASIQLLRTRNGKPYSAAGVMEIIVNQPRFDRNSDLLQDFMQHDLQSLLDSPSSGQLASVALACGQPAIIESLLIHKSPNTERALCSALTRVDENDLNQESRKHLLNSDIEDPSGRQIIAAIMQNPALTDLHAKLCNMIQQSTSANSSIQTQEAALLLIELLLSGPTSTSTITSSESGTTIMSNLLVMADSNTAISEKASSITTKFNSKSQSDTGSIAIIQQQLNGEGTPLSIFTLIDLATTALQQDSVNATAMIPTTEMWEKALMPHTSFPRPYSLPITSPLQGVVYDLTAPLAYDRLSSIRDQDEFSLVFRLTIYVTRLLASDITSKLNNDHLRSLYASYPLALQLVNEKLTTEDANEIWMQSIPEVIQEASDVLSEGNKLVKSWLQNEEFLSYWINILHELKEADVATYIKSLAWISIAAQQIDQSGPSRLLSQYEDKLKKIHRSDSILQDASLLAVLREYLTSTSYGKRILNELVADVTELKGDSLRSVYLLNILLHSDSDGLEAIPIQRVVFLLKKLVSLLNDNNTTSLQAEVMKLLAAIVPQVSDIYGEHWEQILAAIIKLWSSDVDISSINSSVRLYAQLKGVLTSEEVNEDLQDAWNAVRDELDAGLLDCLQQLGHTTRDIDQPRTITAELVRRQLKDFALRSESDVFSLLSSPVEAVQTAAFEILHRAIPQQQEQLSVELILEKQTVQLPEKLVALLSDAEPDVRRYLLAWKLIFDHFPNASHKLQEAYTVNIKQSDHIGKFLDYTCEVLRIVSGRPVDASKFDVANFNVDKAEFSQNEIQWLSIHNYYNALLYVPSLAKEWFISQKNRIKSPLEVWTQKHISPIIVAASLSTVASWATTQPQDEDDRPLTIKTSPRASELTASIAIDPESPPISLAIALPGSYPLESPIVNARTRVGVSDKNWQSWLRTIQIIIFSTGSIIEGLVAFRRNVQGALKGQSECAICYSIIGTDMQTPNKKCGTCKNMFHGTCLFRWFKSSNSSSCPLCRNNFNYA